jgi:hypothetical protein
MRGYVQSEKVRTKAPLKALEFVETFEEPAVFILGGQDRLPYFEVIRRIRGGEFEGAEQYFNTAIDYCRRNDMSPYLASAQQPDPRSRAHVRWKSR